MRWQGRVQDYVLAVFRRMCPKPPRVTVLHEITTLLYKPYFILVGTVALTLASNVLRNHKESIFPELPYLDQYLN